MRNRGTIERTITLVGDLLAGREHDRRSIARAVGVELAAADRYVLALEQLDGVVVERRERRKYLRYRPKRTYAKGAKR